MNFIRIGNRFLNLDNVTTVELGNDGGARVQFNVTETDWFNREELGSAKAKRAARGKQPPSESMPLAEYFEGDEAKQLIAFLSDVSHPHQMRQKAPDAGSRKAGIRLEGADELIASLTSEATENRNTPPLRPSAC